MLKNLTDLKNFQEFNRLEFIAKHVVEGFITGMHKSPFHGFSVEFAEHRIYNSGESVRHIDWRLLARSEKMFVKRFEEETNLRAHILLDISSSMLFPLDNILQSKLAFSVYASSALIYLLRKQRDAVGLSFLSDKIDLLTEAKVSAVHAKFLYAKLAELLAELLSASQSHKFNSRKTHLADSIHLLAEKLHKRSLVILFTDMFEHEHRNEIFDALQHLTYNKHELIVFHVYNSELEQKFNFMNRPHKFIDLESGRILKLQPGQIKDSYQKKSNEFYSEIALMCRKYKIDMVKADVHQDFREILWPFLVKRSKMF
jgi:uncharacterized protein (DUF58 family)